MPRFFRYKLSKAKAKEFALLMDQIADFCNVNNISASNTSDSYYFAINGQQYRVSNHSVEASNKSAYNAIGEKLREKYHSDKRDNYVIYIHASKTRIMDIYNDLKAGYVLDGRGNRR